MSDDKSDGEGICDMLDDGYSLQEIADHLGISMDLVRQKLADYCIGSDALQRFQAVLKEYQS